MATVRRSAPNWDRIYGTIYGHCIGDAIGLLTEFMTKREAHEIYGKYKESKGLEYEYKSMTHRHQTCWSNGDWTDDSDQMILMMQSIVDKKGKVDAIDYARRLKHWAQHGFPELGDRCGNGLGGTTLCVMQNTKFDTDPHKAAHTVWEYSGEKIAPNGAVMRTSVMGIYRYDDLSLVARNTLEFCKVTHADPRCQASCIAVTTAIALMLQGKYLREKSEFDVSAIIGEAFENAQTYLSRKDDIDELKRHMYAESLAELDLAEERKIGYTFKALGAGFWALKQNDFRRALEDITMEAGDADTNGAVAGALLGCKLGYKALPKTWLSGLVEENKQWLDDIIKSFLDIALPPENTSANKTNIAASQRLRISDATEPNLSKEPQPKNPKSTQV